MSRPGIQTDTQKVLPSNTMGQSRANWHYAMPVTSSTSSIKRWPTSDVVLGAANAWATSAAAQRPDLIALGCFGSCARGDAGFGSDLDFIAVVSTDDRPAAERGLDWRTEALPVPVDLLVYTLSEWTLLGAEGGCFAQTLKTEARGW